MMKANPARKGRLFIVIIGCLPLLITSVFAWVVNLDIGLKEIKIDIGIIDSVIPSGIYNLLAGCAADLSTVTTFVAVIVFLYPILHALKIINVEGNDPSKLENMEIDPYPSQFVLFLVLLGLAGTLYGMLIGLHSSGVATVGEAGGSNVTESINALLRGIATAILSSLAGLVGAFIAASPISRIFKWAACPSEEEELDLLAALQGLASHTGGGAATASTGVTSAEDGGQVTMGAQTDDIVAQLSSLVQAVRENNNEVRQSKEALKKALALYISERL